ncbi:MAG TPA: phosphate acyltransferase PlsX [Nitrospira sp.]|nr:phosphate acyltransferase PlsX [Nitrospira sp.]MBX7038674.1 phosphate acyltransferase PlsX [Nitrospira sp.]MCW5793279.1 phosphate acyltransferase PlsX [Nitrospira sp.]HMU30792.1 phosphate acyltransferase PlsX [Nitrospira sp.]HMV57434.1 phosphate acyltransferase PlsX [Nitrospira sp.]
MKIAVDAMGGDHGPAPVIEGAMQAAQELGVGIILVGKEDELTAACRKLNCNDTRITIRHAPQVVEMHESPAAVARKKRDSSIWVATELVKSGEADAVVSPGNTGASMVASFFVLGLIKGVERPAIATMLPTLTGSAIMLDVGANVDCSAQHLEQFALMGNEFARHVYAKPNPRVGLLSIGEEDSKGNEVTKEAFKLLKTSPLNFIGNIEGREVYSGSADVVVCDGFIGNVALKISEGVADVIKKLLMKELSGSWLGRLAYPLIAKPLLNLKRKIDYAEFGGAPLLGVNGTTMICHGRSSAKAIKNAIRRAKGLAETRLDELIQRDIEESLRRHQDERLEDKQA